VLGQERFELSKRALLQRQRAARKETEESLAKTHGANDAREIAFHLSECFEGSGVPYGCAARFEAVFESGDPRGGL